MWVLREKREYFNRVVRGLVSMAGDGKIMLFSIVEESRSTRISHQMAKIETNGGRCADAETWRCWVQELFNQIVQA